MSKLTQGQRITVKGEGICPKCGGIGVYEYVITGPVAGNGNDLVEIKYTFRCMVCGFKEEKRVMMPLQGIYPLRHLLHKDVRIFLEKIFLISKSS